MPRTNAPQKKATWTGDRVVGNNHIQVQGTCTRALHTKTGCLCFPIFLFQFCFCFLFFSYLVSGKASAHILYMQGRVQGQQKIDCSYAWCISVLGK
ncbi:hypothetical protein HDV63DRAFT_366375 [Trichoderma sp. SZMC 28014]